MGGGGGNPYFSSPSVALESLSRSSCRRLCGWIPYILNSPSVALESLSRSSCRRLCGWLPYILNSPSAALESLSRSPCRRICGWIPNIVTSRRGGISYGSTTAARVFGMCGRLLGSFSTLWVCVVPSAIAKQKPTIATSSARRTSTVSLSRESCLVHVRLSSPCRDPYLRFVFYD